MLSSLKERTFRGVTWSFIDSISGSGISFIIGIILARLLSPSEFGLIGIVTVFLAFSNTFIDSGFSTGLIRKVNCKIIELETVFWFNIVVSFFLYFVLFFSSATIARFFSEPQLNQLLRLIGLVIIVDSLSLVQRTILIRRLDFKTQTKISLISTLTSGVVGVGLAFYGYGVWSLAAQIIMRQTMVSFLLWVFSQWKPKLRFSPSALRDLFGFGSKILGSQLIITTQNQIYYFIIGKFFSASSLGFFTRAEQFNAIVTNSITGTMERVFFPVLASLQNEEPRLKETIRKTLRTSFFITYLALVVLAIAAKPIVYLLLGAKWYQSIVFLQLLCIGSVFFPFNVVNLNILKIKGRSDLILKLQIIKTGLVIINIVIGILWGIVPMLTARIFTTIYATYLNGRYSGNLLNYSFRGQLNDILPYFKSNSIILVVVLGISFLPLNNYLLLALEMSTSILLFFLIFEKSKHEEYFEIKGMLLRNFNVGHK
jgi:O-antigen/teichoic acid export membrane protein